MTFLSPSLRLNGIGVYKNSRPVLAVPFHSGVNIVRGHNSSGKTTVMDFVAYALGAENIPWKSEALLCDEVVAEIVLNEKIITIRRSVNDSPLNPLYIFWGTAANALSAPAAAWEVYPFKRSTNKISFTQSLLLAMDLPEAQGDGASNLTMHQFLRVLYADQPSLHSPIFRNDTFDSALTRETVGNYLCGIYDDKLYVLQLERRTLEKDIAALDAELRSIYRVLATSRQDVNFEFIGQQILTIEGEQRDLAQELSSLKKRRGSSKPASTSEDTSIRAELNNAKAELVMAEEQLTRRELEVTDSSRFVHELEVRLTALEESSATRSYFGTVAISFCPCCLNEVSAPKPDSTECPLCKSSVRNSTGDAQVLRMKNELRIQLKESQVLSAKAEGDISDLKSRLPGLRHKLRALESRFVESASTWSTDIESSIERIARRMGTLEQEVIGLQETQRLGLVIAELQASRNRLAERQSAIDQDIDRLGLAQEQRKKKVSLLVAETLASLLRQDMYRQEEFKSASNIQFSFVDNEVSVEGATQFSESSTVVLRHLFHVALLSAADKVKEMRLPRFMMLDGIEDGGMELPRAHRLQEIIVGECETFKHDYQLIIATSQIAPSLDLPQYVVGRNFSENQRSIEITQSKSQ